MSSQTAGEDAASRALEQTLANQQQGKANQELSRVTAERSAQMERP